MIRLIKDKYQLINKYHEPCLYTKFPIITLFVIVNWVRTVLHLTKIIPDNCHIMGNFESQGGSELIIH